jgi:hypothetical protein
LNPPGPSTRLKRQPYFGDFSGSDPKSRFHGFNNRFEDAVFRLAQSIHDSGAEVVPVLFILASPDVDVYVAQKQITMGPRTRRPRFLLFASADERALAVSRALHSDQRLGSIDPDQEPWKDTLRSEGMRTFNLSRAPSGDITHHDKPLEVPQVVTLVGQIIMSGQGFPGVVLQLAHGRPNLVLEAALPATTMRPAGGFQMLPRKLIWITIRRVRGQIKEPRLSLGLSPNASVSPYLVWRSARILAASPK